MSLLVWLPLNGNVNNYGLNKVTLTGNGGSATYLNGKIGKCLLVNGRYITISPITLGSEASVCYWSKTTVNGKMVWTSSAFSEKLNIYENNIYTLNTGDGNNNPFKNNGSNINVLHDGLWHHFAVTFGNNESKLYIDGEYRGTAINFRSPAITNGQIKLAGGYDKTHTYDWNGSIDDFRVYNHCLSPKEVKEISQGLVLHYTLDDYSRNTLLPPGVELYDYILSSGTLWIDTEVYGYMNHTYEIEFLQNDTGIYRLWGVFGLSSYIGYNMSLTYGGTNVWLLRWNSTSSGLNNVTLASIDTDRHIFKVVNGHVYFDNVSKGTVVGHNSNLSINHNLFLFTINPAGATLTNNAKAKIYKYKDTDVNGNVVRNMLPCTYLGEPGMWDTVENKFYKNLGTGQFILGNKIATTYSNSIVYDCSGYLNNGLSVNTLTMSDSSPRYSHSIKFNRSAIKVTDNNWLSLGMEQLTINVWVKASSWPTNTRIFSCTETGGFNIESGDSGYYKFLVNVYTNSGKTSYAYKSETLEILISELPTNLWFMMTFVYNATEGTKSYINGLLNHTYTYQSYGIHFNTSARLFLGCEPNTATPTTPYFSGEMSDFRIYTTALSDEDIRELYNTSTIIDNLNNLHTRELIEDNMDYVEISKKGIVKTDSLTEGNNGVIFSSDNIECNQLIEI